MKVVITDYYYQTLDRERAVLSILPDVSLEAHHCKDEDRVCELVKDADAVIVQFAPITRRVISCMSKCKLIVRYAIGVDNIDIEAATEKGIYVANVPDYSIDEVSNHAIAILFALAKKIVPLNQAVKEGKWDYKVSQPLYRMNEKTLGLVGFGRIPVMIAEKMANFGLNILCYDPFVAKETTDIYGVEKVDFETLLIRSDYISVHCPLTESTHHLFGAEQFGLMKPTALLINTARGAVIDEKALISALRQGKIAAAGLDVLETEPVAADNPLVDMNNVILTPHGAWYSEEAIESLQTKVAEEVVRVLQGGAPKNLVNKVALQLQNS